MNAQLPGRLRLRVPLVITNFIGPDRRPLDGVLHEIGPGVLIARVPFDPDRARVSRSYEDMVVWDLEVLAGPMLAGISAPDATAVVRRILGLVTCVVRFAPSFTQIVVERWSGDQWLPVDRVRVRGAPIGSSFVPVDRMATWGQLVEHWPLLGLEPAVDRALDLHFDSVSLRRTHPTTSFLLSLTAIDTLMSVSVVEREQATLLARRSATLFGADDADALTRVAVRWSDAYQSLVRHGIEPDPEVLVGLHRFMMRALPTFGRLLPAVGRNHQHSLGWIDSRAGAPQQLNDILNFQEDEPWWNYVSIDAIVDASA